LDSGNILTKNILVPAIDFYSAPVSFWQHLRKNIHFTMIGCAGLFQNGILIELRMGRGGIPAMEIQIILLFPMIRQRLIRDLTAGNAPSVSKCGEEDRIHRTSFLDDIQDLVGAFVHKRNRADLNTDHLLRSGCFAGPGRHRAQERDTGRGGRAGSNEVAAGHPGKIFIHGPILKAGRWTNQPKTF